MKHPGGWHPGRKQAVKNVLMSTVGHAYTFSVIIIYLTWFKSLIKNEGLLPTCLFLLLTLPYHTFRQYKENLQYFVILQMN